MTVPTLEILNGIVDMGMIEELAKEAAAVEEELTFQMRSKSKLVEQVGHHTLKAGGKRLRPAFVFVGAKATERPFQIEKTRRIGVCMEMILSLIHIFTTTPGMGPPRYSPLSTMPPAT